jgi:hypothetical protein
MDDPRETLKRNAELYAFQRSIQLEQQLGSGIDGIVWATTRKSAVKAHERRTAYYRERNVYYRFRDHEVLEILGSSVPALVDQDDELQVLEIEIVEPPWIIDFAHAYLDAPPDYPEEVLAERLAEQEELFGEKWPKVRSILAALRGYGIYYLDASPKNIRFPEDDD